MQDFSSTYVSRTANIRRGDVLASGLDHLLSEGRLLIQNAHLYEGKGQPRVSREGILQPIREELFPSSMVRGERNLINSDQIPVV
jgi:hypothetical protein